MVVLLVAAGCALISAGTAQAHSALVGSTPSADAVLDTAPSSVELVFNQEIQTSFANVTVSAADGTQVGAGEPSVQPSSTSSSSQSEKVCRRTLSTQSLRNFSA